MQKISVLAMVSFFNQQVLRQTPPNKAFSETRSSRATMRLSSDSLILANLGYWVRTSHTGKGIATEAVKLTAQYGFEKLGFQRIEIIVTKDNLPSLKVAEKVGAIREGLLRNRINLQGSTYDAYMYSLIPTDYAINKTA